MDSSGTTYFSPLPYISETLDNINLYLSKSTNKNNTIEKKEAIGNVCKWTKNITPGSEFPNDPLMVRKIIMFFKVCTLSQVYVLI